MKRLIYYISNMHRHNVFQTIPKQVYCGCFSQLACFITTFCQRISEAQTRNQVTVQTARTLFESS